MIVLIQRVAEASVSVEGRVTGVVGRGLLALVCGEPGDTPAVIGKLARKTARLRIFKDEAGRMNRSVVDVGGDVLCVSQFTLAADTMSGNRPSFSRAAPPEEGLAAFNAFVTALRGEGLSCPTGEFGAHMRVSLVNDGPATFSLHLRVDGAGAD